MEWKLVHYGKQDNEVVNKYSLRHRKCGVQGYIHELFVSKPERARYERVRAFDTNAAKSEKLFECKRCTILIGSQRP